MLRISTLLSLGALSFAAVASPLSINNGNFDAQSLTDGVFTSGNVQGWATVSGSAGIYNPPEAVFSGESGDGTHSNTLYLNGNSIVSQTLNASLSANTNYSISFDVGDRFDTAMPNYIFRIKVAGNTVFNAINPVIPQTDGSFETVNLSFNSGNSGFAGNLMTIELEATGTGQVNLDNFVMTATEDPNGGTSQFGEWNHWDFNGVFYDLNTVYHAETDGFITYQNSGTCNNNIDQIRISNQAGQVNEAYIHRVNEYGGMMSPVKKGQYWRVERFRSGSNCQVRIGFLPLVQ